MNKTFALVAAILSITALVTSSAIPIAEAKPLKFSETIDGVNLICSANHGILSCTVKSFSGGTFGSVLMTNPNPADGSLSLCDADESDKKRKSVTNRNSENCPDSFVKDQKLRITVLQVTPGNNLVVEVTHQGNGLEFAVIPM